ncbi:MAG: putative toxin-antitoxin system toxin component, PIN family [Candidatus Gottesmanbacteria bacterium]|nr:putative toxin-antitoxin system toxin component, PIN family [Candidatus Gottesmanbacteria bacterium]
MISIVCDTNVLISALIYGGNPERIIFTVEKDELTLFLSPAILLELSRILRVKFGWQEYQIHESISYLGKLCTIINPDKRITRIRTDPSDNRILECALAAKADFIVSGDKRHLLSIKKFRGIPIVSPATFLSNLI